MTISGYYKWKTKLYGPITTACRPMWIDDWVVYFTAVKVQSISHHKFVSLNNQPAACDG
jgi:hypothetical protein